MSSSSGPVHSGASNETFTLPDMTPVNVNEVEEQEILVSIGEPPANYHKPRPKEEQEKGLKPIAKFVALERKAIANHPFADTIDDNKEVAVREFVTLDANISFDNIWVALYGFWIRNIGGQRSTIHIGSSFSNQEKVYRYIIYTGLGFRASDAKHEYEVVLDEAAFWQGAGAPLDRAWIRSPQPHPDIVGSLLSTKFPHVCCVSNKENRDGGVLHPLRPPKPPAGAIIYSRYDHSTGAHIQLSHIDPSNEEHFSKFHSWMNNDQNPPEWKQQGSEEAHRSFLQRRKNDPSVISVICTWDGEFAGYGDIVWCREDSTSAYGENPGEYEQGIRCLVGEAKYQKGNYPYQMSLSMKHFCFLREPRADYICIAPLLSDKLVKESVQKVKSVTGSSRLHHVRFYEDFPVNFS